MGKGRHKSHSDSIEEENHHHTWKYIYTLHAFNAIVLFMGFVLIGSGIFIEYGYDDTGTSLVDFPLSYLVIGAGVAACLLPIIGYVGVKARLWWLLAIYFQLVLLLLLFEICFAFLVVAYSGNIQEQVLKGWLDADDDIKNDIQKQFECCGFESAADGSAGSKCPKNAEIGCGPAIQQEILGRLKLFIGVGGFAAGIEVFACISAAAVMYRIPKKGEIHTDSYWSDALAASEVTTEED